MFKKFLLFIFTIAFINCFSNAEENIFSDQTNITPLETLYLKLGDDVTPYHRYAQFFLDTKIGGDKELLQKILTTEDRFLKYYEAILKGLYAYYFGDKAYGIDLLLRAYDRAYSKMENTFEGFLIQNIFATEGIYDKLNIISDHTYCLTIAREIDRKACLSAVTLSSGILNHQDYPLLLVLLKKEDSNLASYTHKYLLQFINSPESR